MFGHDALPSKIFSYGAKPPTINADIVTEQLSLAHRYKNRLIEIERNRRDAVAAAMLELHPKIQELTDAVAAAEAEIESLRTAIKARNKEARAKQPATIERAKIKEIGATLKLLRADLKAEKSVSYDDPETKLRLEAIDAEAAVTAKTARAESGLYWGNYLAIEQGLGSIRKGPPPRFHRWTGDGKLCVQIQGGMPVAQLMACDDSRARVEPVNPEAFAGAFDGKRAARSRLRCLLHIRVGSDGRKPIFATFPFTLHRPLPEDCSVKWIYVTRRRVGTHYDWQVQFVVSDADGFTRDDACNVGSVGIDVGWRLVPEGLRVAYWVGDDGREGELIIPRERMDRWRKVDDLRGIRDTNFAPVRDRLAGWIKTNSVPDWMTERASTLRDWRSTARLASFVLYWRENRFDGDAEAFEAAEAWRKQDKHLYDWESHQRAGNARWRKDFYRNFAAQMRRMYRVAFVEKINLAALRMDQPPESEKETSGAFVAYRNLASVGELLQCLRESLTETVPREAANSTMTCHVCGAVENFDAGAELLHTCSECGTMWDQDRNAAVNLLRDSSGPVTQKTP